MPSPFPGMDPFIEAQKWEDFHTSFITAIRETLVLAVRPKYSVDVERRVYLETHDPETPPQRWIADVGVFQSEQKQPRETGGVVVATEHEVQPKVCSLPYFEEHREAYLIIRRGSPSRIVAVIELLSPTNKLPGSDGRRQYTEKRLELLQTSAHFVELDLLRGGARMPVLDPPSGDYFAIVSRVTQRPAADVYAWPLAHPLPPIPIPLADGDPDVKLSLQKVFNLVYDRAGYDYSLDYEQPVSPPLAEEQVAWVRERLKSRST